MGKIFYEVTREILSTFGFCKIFLKMLILELETRKYIPHIILHRPTIQMRLHYSTFLAHTQCYTILMFSYKSNLSC
jgi:hypothetical protein